MRREDYEDIYENCQNYEFPVYENRWYRGLCVGKEVERKQKSIILIKTQRYLGRYEYYKKIVPLDWRDGRYGCHWARNFTLHRDWEVYCRPVKTFQEELEEVWLKTNSIAECRSQMQIHHPDKGGDVKEFMKWTAKLKTIRILTRKSKAA